jgi:pyruvate dehydrogenase E2 component (dihydrolipoamide acetyltransferase)
MWELPSTRQGGLLVRVIRDADSKAVAEIAAEISEVSMQARTKGLPLARMSGGCFTLSSLGSLGGTGFTPIINAPELAIMGITRAFQKPVNAAGEVVWRTMIPLSLSYDHRFINGADAARFCITFAKEWNDAARDIGQ